MIAVSYERYVRIWIISSWLNVKVPTDDRFQRPCILDLVVRPKWMLRRQRIYDTRDVSDLQIAKIKDRRHSWIRDDRLHNLTIRRRNPSMKTYTYESVQYHEHRNETGERRIMEYVTTQSLVNSKIYHPDSANLDTDGPWIPSKERFEFSFFVLVKEPWETARSPVRTVSTILLNWSWTYFTSSPMQAKLMTFTKSCSEHEVNRVANRLSCNAAISGTSWSLERDSAVGLDFQMHWKKYRNSSKNHT